MFLSPTITASPDKNSKETADIVQELEKNPDLKEKLLKMLQDRDNNKDSTSDSTNSTPSDEQINEFIQRGDKYANDKNYAEAVKWYRKAADQGHQQAKEVLDYLAQKLILIQ